MKVQMNGGFLFLKDNEASDWHWSYEQERGVWKSRQIIVKDASQEQQDWGSSGSF